MADHGARHDAGGSFTGEITFGSDNAYQWDPGRYTLVVEDFTKVDGKFGPSVEFRFHEAGNKEHLITARAGLKASPQGKLAAFVSAMQGCSPHALTGSTINLNNCVGKTVVGDVTITRKGDGTPFATVATLFPMPAAGTDNGAPTPALVPEPPADTGPALLDADELATTLDALATGTPETLESIAGNLRVLMQAHWGRVQERVQEVAGVKWDMDALKRGMDVNRVTGLAMMAHLLRDEAGWQLGGGSHAMVREFWAPTPAAPADDDIPF